MEDNDGGSADFDYRDIMTELRISPSELDSDVKFAYGIYMSFSILCIITFFVLLFITVKVI